MPEDIFRWFVLLGVLLALLTIIAQAAILYIVSRVGRRTASRGLALAGRAEAMLATTETFLRENDVKIDQIGNRAVEAATTTRETLVAVNQTIGRFAVRAREKTIQTDEGIDTAIEKTGQAADAVKTAMAKPVREVRGVIQGVQTAASVYRRRRPDRNGAGAP
jgi:hypothetical protein